MQGATRVLAEWAASLSAGDLPAEIRHHARRAILDYVAATVVGSTTESSQAVRSYLLEAYGGDAATVVCGGTLSAAGAALANGTAAHGLEVDNGYNAGGTHPSVTTLPAVLAAAERHGASNERTLLAAVVALEVACRVARAGYPATWRAGFHTTPLAGVFGATAGVASILGAGAAQFASAFGLAGSHAGGIFEFIKTGSDVKRLHAGKAARDGLVCAELAMRGLDGPQTIFEGEYGYFAAFARGEWRPDALIGDLGRTWDMARAYFKPYPCCRHVHAPIDGVLALRQEHAIAPDSVVGIDIETFANAARHVMTETDTLLAAQMSIPYGVAVALRDGEVGFDQYSADTRDDETIHRLASVVRVRATPEYDRAYPKLQPARITLTLADGRKVSKEVDQPSGSPDRPIDDEGLALKFRRMCVPVIGPARTQAAFDSIWQGPDFAHLYPLLRDAATGSGPFGA